MRSPRVESRKPPTLRRGAAAIRTNRVTDDRGVGPRVPFGSSVRLASLSFLVVSAIMTFAGSTRSDEPARTTEGRADAPAGTTGDSPDVPPEQLADEGKALAREKRWEEALVKFRAAYAQRRSYDVVGNLGITEHELGHYVPAAKHLSEALRGFPVSGLAIQRQALQERLVEVRAQVVELNLTVSPSTSCLRVAGEDRGCGPFNVPIFAAAGEILLEVEAPGHRPEKRLLDQAPGSRVEVDLALRPFPASEESATPSISASGTASSDRPNDETAATLLPAWPAFVVAGIALAALGTGAGLSVVANTKEEDAAERLAELRNASDRASPCAPPQADTASCEAIASALQSHDTLTNAGTGLIVSGVGVLAVAGVMYGLSWVESDRDDGAAWMVVPQLAAARDATVVGLGALGAW